MVNTQVSFDELQELFTYAKVSALQENKPLYETLDRLVQDASLKKNHLLANQYDLLRVLYKGSDYSATAVRGTLWQLAQHYQGQQ